VLSAIAKPPLASTSVIGLTAFDKIKRDRVSLDHRFTGGQGLIQSPPRPRSTIRTARPASIRPRTATPPPTAPRRHLRQRASGARRRAAQRRDIGGVKHKFVWGGDASITRQQGVRDGTVPPAGETFPTRAFPTTDYTLAGPTCRTRSPSAR
jgi:hemoglobin/transferrin/lactoferrin receptor protein